MKKTPIAEGTFYLTISSLVFLISAYALNIFLGRYFGPLEYGVYGVILSLVTLINLIQTSGLPKATAKYISENEEKSEEILKASLFVQVFSTIFISILFFLLSKPVSYLLNDYSLVPYLQLSSLIFPLYGIFQLYSGYYNGLHNFKKQAFMDNIYSLTKVLLVFGLAYLFRLKGVIIGFIISPFIAIISGFYFPKRNVEFFPCKKIILFSLPLTGFAFLLMLLQSVDLYFVKALTQSENNPGFYTANQNISKIPFFALNAFVLVLFPSISKSVSENQIEKARLLIQKSLRFVVMLLVPVVFLISVTSAQIVNLLYSNSYLPASPSLSVLIFASGFLTVFTVLASILSGAGEPNKPLIISFIGVVVTLFLCSLMIPRYSMMGAALSSAAGSFISMVIAIYFVYKKFKVLIPHITTFKIISASLFISVLANFIKLPGMLLPILYVFLFLIYIFILIMAKEITHKDWEMIRRPLKI